MNHFSDGSRNKSSGTSGVEIYSCYKILTDAFIVNVCHKINNPSDKKLVFVFCTSKVFQDHYAAQNHKAM